MQDQWTVCTYGSRLRNSKSEAGKWTSEEIDLTDRMKTLLEGRGLKYQNGMDLGCLIAEQKDTEGSKDFFDELFKLLRLTLQLRNSHVGTDNQTDNTSDYILSCVKDGKGQFFDSRCAPQDMPQKTPTPTAPFTSVSRACGCFDRFMRGRVAGRATNRLTLPYPMRNGIALYRTVSTGMPRFSSAATILE